MQYFYDGQIRRYLLQIVRLLSNFVVRYGDGTLVRVPVMYGDQDRQAATIVNQNSENTLQSAPRIAIYITDLDLDNTRLGDATLVSKMHFRERDIDDNGNYTSTQGQNYTVERLMPTPFKLSVKADIWSTSTEQKLQILEQILVLFNPSLEIQTTDNFVDWTSLTVVDLGDVSFTSRTVPMGTATQIDIATLTLTTPIWITPPAKVKKLGVVTNIISSAFDSSSMSDAYVDGLGVYVDAGQSYPGNSMASAKTTLGNFDIVVSEGKIKLVSSTQPGVWLNWQVILQQNPGSYTAGLAKIYLLQPDGSEVVGYLSLNPLDESEMVVNWDEDTFPSNYMIVGPARAVGQRGSFDAVIDPTTTGPSNIVPGTRYLIIDNIGGGIRDTFVTGLKIQKISTIVEFDKVRDCQVFVNSVEVGQAVPQERDGNYVIILAAFASVGSTVTYVLNLNEDGPAAWKNTDSTNFIAGANDIIEWDGSKWWVIFSADENSENLIYQTNIYTLVQYKWNGVNWVKSFDGDYRRGDWRLEL